MGIIERIAFAALAVSLSLGMASCSGKNVPVKPKAKLFIVVQQHPIDGHPLWSPDGRILYFTHRPATLEEIPPGSGFWYFRDVDSSKGVYSLDLATGARRRLADHALSDPELSPDGQVIFFSDEGQIWRAPLGPDSVMLGAAYQVTNVETGAFEPSVDSAGTRLLFSTSATSQNPGIYLTSTTGGIARHVGGTAWHSPDWRPNDSSFAFVSESDVVVGIGVVDTFGAGAVQIRRDGHSPKWSPDGSKIAYLSPGSAVQGPDRLWLMNRDGAQARSLTTDNVLEGFSWSPDGSVIAYTRFVLGDTSRSNGTIWTINPITLERRQLTTDSRP